MSEYNITAKTLDEMMAILVAQTLPQGMRNKNAWYLAEELAIKVCEAFELPENLIDEALALFQRRIHALGIAG